MTGFSNVLRAAVAGVVLAGAGVAHGQLQQLPRDSSPGMPGASGPPPDRTSVEIRERMEKARNDERQKRLISDTDKLLALATSLKTDVDKTDKYTLSLDVIHRTEEIEKLSRSIRDRMKQ